MASTDSLLNPLGFAGLPCHHGVAKPPDVGCPGFPRSPPSDTKGPEQSGPFVFAEVGSPLPHAARSFRKHGCKHPWRRPASGKGACRWRKGGFRPFFEMCTCRRASVHGLGKIPRRRHFADARRDSHGGINHLDRSHRGRPPASVAVVPKDSGPNVAVVPKDSWTSAACDGRIVVSNVAVLPNDGADLSPPPPSPGWNRRGIGRESALRRIVRTSPFCQSKAIQGGIRPPSEGGITTITQ